MRTDALFIGIEIDDGAAKDAELAAKLEEVCPVDIFAGGDGGVTIVESNVDECILCAMCLKAAPGAVKVLKLYDDDAALQPQD